MRAYLSARDRCARQTRDATASLIYPEIGVANRRTPASNTYGSARAEPRTSSFHKLLRCYDSCDSIVDQPVQARSISRSVASESNNEIQQWRVSDGIQFCGDTPYRYRRKLGLAQCVRKSRTCRWIASHTSVTSTPATLLHICRKVRCIESTG